MFALTDSAPPQRHQPRHNQIAIRLHQATDGDWQRIDAQQWNERGFCFFHPRVLQVGPTAFKRSLQHFGGEIMWSRACHDEMQVAEMLLNEAIHRQADRLPSQPETRQRLLRLMRVQGMVDAKQRVLAALGGMPEPAQWQSLVQQRLQAGLFQSGVRIDSPVWTAVVADALALGSVVQDLERWSGSLGA